MRGIESNFLYEDIDICTDERLTDCMPSLDICIDEKPVEHIQEVIIKNHKEYNESVVGPFIEKPFTLHIKNPQGGAIIAGLFGVLAVNYDCLVQIASVDKNFRRQGIGSKMFGELENYARSNGCKNIRLETSAFQAKGFYEKLGYTEIAHFERGYLDHSIHMMQKTLT